MKRPYTIELYRPVSNNPLVGTTHLRVHCGTFEANRDNLSPCMVATKEVEAFTIKGARARAREFLREFEHMKRNPMSHMPL